MIGWYHDNTVIMYSRPTNEVLHIANCHTVTCKRSSVIFTRSAYYCIPVSYTCPV